MTEPLTPQRISPVPACDPLSHGSKLPGCGVPLNVDHSFRFRLSDPRSRCAALYICCCHPWAKASLNHSFCEQLRCGWPFVHGKVVTSLRRPIIRSWSASHYDRPWFRYRYRMLMSKCRYNVQGSMLTVVLPSHACHQMCFETSWPSCLL